MKDKFIETIITSEPLSESGFYESDCFGIEFSVASTSNNMFVNGRLVIAGTAFSIDQNVGYIDRSIYEVNFVVGAGVNEATIVRSVPKNIPKLIDNG